MNKIFLGTINLNITASLIVISILLIRILFKSAPKKYSYILWILLLVRLLIPISIETGLNPINIPSVDNFSQRVIINESNPNDGLVNNIVKDDEIQAGNEMGGNNNINVQDDKKIDTNNSNKFIHKIKLEYIWLLGVIALLASGIISSYRLKKSLKGSRLLYGNIYKNEFINTGFVYGLFKPIILIPSLLDEKEEHYIIAHERVHLKRYDYIIKLLYYIVLSLYWFNPFIWIAFRCMSKDMELSCDEAVLKDLEKSKKIEYAETLLSMSVNKPGGISLLAFNKNDTKSRVKNVLEFKNVNTWISIALVLIIVITAFFIFTESKETNNEIDNSGIYGMENMEFKDPKEAAELLFQKEYDSIMEQSDDKIVILEKNMTNFGKVHSYSGYLDGDLDLYKIEYKIKAENPEMFNVIEYQEDGSITEEKMSLGKPLMVFENTGSTHKYMGLLYLEGSQIENTAGLEIRLIEFLENKELKSKETFEGKHNLVEFKLREGGSYKILLSQPIIQGEEGIWAIDRWMDNHGNIYFPNIGSKLNIEEYYNEIQAKADLYNDKGPLDYKYVALDLIRNYTGINYAEDYRLSYYEDIKLDEFYTLPISEYYGYVMEIKKYEWGENNFIDFDKVEFLTEEDDEERIRELEINPESLSNGYYINNPTSYPESFIIEEDGETKFYIIDDSGVNLKEVDEERFIEYVENNKDRLYKIVEEGFDLIKVSEVYLP